MRRGLGSCAAQTHFVLYSSLLALSRLVGHKGCVVSIVPALSSASQLSQLRSCRLAEGQLHREGESMADTFNVELKVTMPCEVRGQGEWCYSGKLRGGS